MRTQGIPLFMQNPILVDDQLTMPIEGKDYIYDAITQTSIWMGPTNNWTKTMFSDQKVDSVSHITPDPAPEAPQGPSFDMKSLIH